MYFLCKRRNYVVCMETDFYLSYHIILLELDLLSNCKIFILTLPFQVQDSQGNLLQQD